MARRMIEITIQTDEVVQDSGASEYRTSLFLHDTEAKPAAAPCMFYHGMPFSHPHLSDDFAVQQFGRALGRLIDMTKDGL